MKSTAEQITENDRFNLDERIVIIWYLQLLIPSIILAGISLIAGQIVESSSIVFWFLILILIINIIYLIFVILRYKHYTYYFTSSGIVIKYGIIRLDRHVIPYSGIQNINITKSVTDRIFGIGCLKIETASNDVLSQEYLLPGLNTAQYRKVVEYIMEKRKFKSNDTNAHADSNSVLSAIQELTREVKDLKTVLSNKKDK
ncbi:MAG: PH domain-containing protein [Candidatus Micrarchaeia archaeon]